jgi:hypothetical protein
MGRYRPPDTQMQFLQEPNLCRGGIALPRTSIGIGAKALHNRELYIGPTTGPWQVMRGLDTKLKGCCYTESISQSGFHGKADLP